MFWPLALVLGITAIYLPAVHAPPIYDDWHTLVGSGEVMGWRVEAGPELETAQSPLAGRPVTRWSFVITHKLGGGGFAVHRAGNILLHALNALLLLTLLRRLLSESASAQPDGWAFSLAGAAALLWAVHPLQTEAVMYITQRSELLVATWYLLTLLTSWLAMRRPSRLWAVVAVIACGLGMASKEVMASAPLAVLLMDRAFISGSFHAALRRHVALYAGLAFTWLILVVLVAAAPRSWSVGFDHGVSALDYLRTQGQVIAYYLTLIVWPRGQLTHYEWPIVRTWTFPQAVWPGLAVAVLLAGTLWALVRYPRTGFAGACFFMILAPSSSFVPIVTEVAAERRMYLPLAAVMAMVVTLIARAAGLKSEVRSPKAEPSPKFQIQMQEHAADGSTVGPLNLLRISGFGFRIVMCLALVAALILSVLSARRAHEYHRPAILWKQVLEAFPDSVTAMNNLANQLRDEGDWPAAEAYYRRAVEAAPAGDVLWLNLARARLHAGDAERALRMIDHALSLQPRRVRGHMLRAEALAALRRPDEAEASLRAALLLDAHDPLPHTRLGEMLAGQGRLDEAEHHFRAALRLHPSAAVKANLAALLMLKDQPRDAAALCVEALAREPEHLGARVALGQALSRLGRLEEAVTHLQRAARQSPDHAVAHLHLGITLGRLERLDEAVVHLREAARLAEDMPAAHFNLAVALLRRDDSEAAAAHLQRVLELDPDNAQAQALLRRIEP